MTSSALTNISPVDGRYYSQTRELENFFSEFALFKYRVHVEVEYLIALCNLGLKGTKPVTGDAAVKLREAAKNFSVEDAAAIKEIEKKTNHDVKAVEYFVKQKLEDAGMPELREFVHFGLTSQDINNTAIPLSIKGAVHEVLLPLLRKVIGKLKEQAKEWKDVPMLAHTHGQPASPTRLGKELEVFIERTEAQIEQLNLIPFSAKFGGATGNFNAHAIAYPDQDWVSFANDFVNKNLGLNRSQKTTQIEHYDNLAALCDCFKRINNIIIDLDRDLWTYISMEYFKQKINPEETGSSAMPHKVNPIDFENSEGNLGVANALLEHFAGKLPVSRLQRDLTDSTVLRNIGVPFAHMLIAYKSALKGLSKIILNDQQVQADLENNWAVVAEGIQTILRREGYPNPYETLKDLTRGHKKITAEIIGDFVARLNVSDEVKRELKAISPFNYTGV